MRDQRRQGSATVHKRMDAESGMATAEFAVALPAVVLMLSLVLGVVGYLIERNEALHAASVGARLAARGESDAVIRQGVKNSGSSGSVSINRAGGYVNVTVRMAPPKMLSWGMPDVEGAASAVDEKAMP